MSILSILYNDHRALLRLAHALLVTTRAAAPDADAISEARRALARKVMEHLEREGALVLVPLRASADPTHQMLARLYVEGLLSMRLESTAHHGRWTMAAVLADIRGYRESVRALVAGLAERIAWEEKEVFPAAETLLAPPHLRKAS